MKRGKSEAGGKRISEVLREVKEKVRLPVPEREGGRGILGGGRKGLSREALGLKKPS